MNGMIGIHAYIDPETIYKQLISLDEAEAKVSPVADRPTAYRVGTIGEV